MTPDRGAQVGRWHALLLWARGRHAPIAADSAEFTAVRGTGSMPLMFGVASVVEIVVVHLLVPWLWLDIVLGALSVVSVVLLASATAVGRVHPHVLTPEALVLRTSGEVVTTVERSTIVSPDSIAGSAWWLPLSATTEPCYRTRTARTSTSRCRPAPHSSYPHPYVGGGSRAPRRPSACTWTIP
ncbi:hypothetical protein CH262_15185 [Rhodococcus sp. 05-2255-1e]|uniref:hypothetical protein n=1 Tax=Rhodococcus sp. 05-2255-1e TaxID=2022495 RepID=UPI000B9C1078|nr:hypothetical protein [Rhodococcus sp. 05-2255-1e]OZE23426.1 hypothetical protein CH262_15185 [Rhodococcus sp. 05-2255-1e]